MSCANLLKWSLLWPLASPYLYEPIISIPTQVRTAKGKGAHGGCTRKTSTCLRKNASVLALKAFARVGTSKPRSSFISTLLGWPGNSGPKVHGIKVFPVDFLFQAAQSLHSNSACSKTVWVAFSCLSGG